MIKKENNLFFTLIDSLSRKFHSVVPTSFREISKFLSIYNIFTFNFEVSENSIKKKKTKAFFHLQMETTTLYKKKKFVDRIKNTL